MTTSTTLVHDPLGDSHLLRVEDVAKFYGIGCPAMRKRIRLRQDCPGWHQKCGRWVIRRSTFLRWLDAEEGVQTQRGVR